MRRVKLDNTRFWWYLQAVDSRFAVFTRRIFKEYYYTLVDREKNIRGPINAVFGPPVDCDTPEGAQELLDWMQENGGYDVWHVSGRNNVPVTKEQQAAVEALLS